jgi:pyruvate/2-oxoglutarate dehydrogenase complex dihydrolipoamide acyltransferase (E2) component
MQFDLTMPDIGATSEMYLAAWIKEPGQAVVRGEIIAEVLTDKVNTELPCPIDGIVDELLIEEDDRVTVGQVIARLRVAA